MDGYLSSMCATEDTSALYLYRRTGGRTDGSTGTGVRITKANVSTLQRSRVIDGREALLGP